MTELQLQVHDYYGMMYMIFLFLFASASGILIGIIILYRISMRN